MTLIEKLLASFIAVLISITSTYVLVIPAHHVAGAFMVALNIIISAFLIFSWHKEFVAGIDWFVARIEKDSHL